MALDKAGNQEAKHTGLTKFVALFNAAVDWVNARLTARTEAAGDALVLREKGAGENHVTIGPIGNTLGANRTVTLPDDDVDVAAELQRITNLEAAGVGGTLDSANVIVGSDANVATARTMGGDVAISNTGVTTIQASAIDNAKVAADAAIAKTKIEGNALVDADFNALRSYLADGLLVHGDLAISDTAAQFQTEDIAVYTIAGVTYTKAATNNLAFSHKDTVTSLQGEGDRFGGWVVQINAAGTVSTLAETGQSGVVDQNQESVDDALAYAKTIELTAGNVALGWITAKTGDESVWTAQDNELTGISTFDNGQVKALPEAKV
jgi:hypothetical protein